MMKFRYNEVNFKITYRSDQSCLKHISQTFPSPRRSVPSGNDIGHTWVCNVNRYI